MTNRHNQLVYERACKDNCIELAHVTDSMYDKAKKDMFLELYSTGPTYSQFVAALVKPGEDILDSLTPAKCNLWHLASCIPSEGGELYDAVKKYVVYEKILDRENVVEELGDLEFYMEGIRAAVGITREEVLEANVVKLSARYNKLKYSNEDAINRADK